MVKLSHSLRFETQLTGSPRSGKRINSALITSVRPADLLSVSGQSPFLWKREHQAKVLNYLTKVEKVNKNYAR